MESAYSFNIIPENDAERVAALKRYEILYTENEQAFDGIVDLAVTMFECPIAHISFVDEEFEFVKASSGIPKDLNKVERNQSLCALTIWESEMTIFEDASLDERLLKHPYVHGPFGIRFYAAAPLVSTDGYIVGTVCLIDTKPRSFSYSDCEKLTALAKVAMDQVELRLAHILEHNKKVEANQHLAESEGRLQNILDTMAEGVLIVDRNLNLAYANEMAMGIFQLDDVIGRNIIQSETWKNFHIDGTPISDWDHPISLMILKNQAIYDQEIAIERENGERFYISLNAAPLLNSEGISEGGVITLMDVTHRRLLLQQKDEFISVASHELKTPLTSLKAAMQLLERARTAQSQERMGILIEQAGKSLTKLTNLVNDLLDVNRISQGQLRLMKSKFRIADMVNDCCENLMLSGSHKINVTGDLDLEVYADEQKINQVVVNIVNNAIKYAVNTVEINIQVRKENKVAKILVIDFGPGIEKEKLPHVFERYFRSDYAGIQFSGLGLGLYISAQIIKQHGGEIGVESEEGKGSTFWFTLPLY